ncbi:MAG: AAA family ATPase [Vicinamibacteria bacterium]
MMHSETTLDVSALGRDLRHYLTVEEVLREIPARASLPGRLYEGRVTLLVGESASGKSFLELHWAATVASQGGSVVVFMYEADALGPRLAALKDQFGDLTNLYFVRSSEPISPIHGRDGLEVPSSGEMFMTETLRSLAADLQRQGLPPIALVFVDTARMAMTGSEDPSDNVAAFLRSLRRAVFAVTVTPQAAIGLVHHSGWQDGENARKRERGSSAWRANSDVVVFVDTDDDSDLKAVRLTLTTLKNRDAEKAPPLGLVRRQVPVTLPGGETTTSCIIEPDERSYAERAAEESKARALKADFQQQALDHKVLALIHEVRPTNITQIRDRTGRDRSKVSASVTRLLSGGLIARNGQRLPFELTAKGQILLGTSVPVDSSAPPKGGAHQTTQLTRLPDDSRRLQTTRRTGGRS